MVPGPPFHPLYHAWMLTDVGGTFSHHVFVVVDAGIRDSGLGLVCRDHKKFLNGEGENGKHWENEGMVREASGPRVRGGVRSVGMGIPLLPREL